MANRFELANLAWPILVKAARRKPITYEELASALGYRTPRIARFPLWTIQDFCEEKGYAPLTSVVVYKHTRRPGSGFTVWKGELEEAHEQARRFPWDSITTPFGPGSRLTSISVRRQKKTRKDFSVPDLEVSVNGRGPYQAEFRRALLLIYGSRCAAYGPFFFDEKDWIPVPESWAPNIVRGRTFDTEKADGSRLWNAVSEYLRVGIAAANELEEPARYGAEYLKHARLGQGAFRVLVTEAYERRCAITGERTLPVLEAAHIKPYSETGPHLISNGLLLRSDVHILFDGGYVTVTEDLKVEVSKRIKEEFENGREYYQYRGKSLTIVSGESTERPSGEFLCWHNENKFLG